MPEDISKHANLTREEDIRQAEAGPDWVCKYCNGTRRRLDGECFNCGGEKENPTNSRTSKPNYNYVHCVIPELNFDCSQPVRKKIIWPYIVGAVVLFVGFIVWAFSPTYVNAAVVTPYWESSIEVQKHKYVKEEGWNIPGDAELVHNEGRRVHHYDRVRVGSHQESYYVQEPCGQDCRMVLPTIWKKKDC